MEVMGSNSHLKDTKPSSADNMYSCHLSRDMNFAMSPTSRSKGEADIGLLVACKVQLSSEVIKWKTENLRLTKELDSALHASGHLKETVSKLEERTKDLEARLNQAEDENLHLKRRSVTLDEEKAAIVQRISMGFNKYHSFPYSESSKSVRLSRESLKLQKSFDQPVIEDYIQVSHTLLHKMKQEIQEFREMSCQYRVKDEGEHSVARDTETSKVDLKCEEPCDVELEETVLGLLSETKSMKQCLLDQRRKLQRLMLSINPDEHSLITPSNNHEMHRSPSHNVKVSTCKPTDNSEYVAHTKYTGTEPSLRKSSLRKENVALNTAIGDASQLQPGLLDTQQNLNQLITTQYHKGNDEVVNNSDHRICPICEESFNDKTQKEFEEHVLNHLERESASLLDQYVVI